MRPGRHLRSLYRTLVHGSRLDRGLDEEVSSYIDLLTDEKTAAGLSAADARRAARLEVEGADQLKEHVRRARPGAWLEEAGRDVRYALRGLRRQPGFTLVAVVTLALGIGANTAVFTVVNGVLLAPLPLPQPDRLYLVSYTPHTGDSPDFGAALADRHFLEFRQRDQVFDNVSTFDVGNGTLTGAGAPKSLTATTVTAAFLKALRLAPARGRDFETNDEAPAGPHVAIISDALWRDQLAADPAVIGRSITIDGVARVVVGVMPPGVVFPFNTDIWLVRGVTTEPHNLRMLRVVGRLRQGRTPSDARAEITALAGQFWLPPDENRQNWHAGIEPLKDYFVGDARTPLVLFGGAVAFVLLIACANVGNLLLIRASGRRHEMALRSVLGASRGRLARLVITESLVISLLGGAAGLVLAVVGVPVLLRTMPDAALPRLDMIHVDGAVLLFTFGCSVAAGLVFGAAPALRVRREALAGLLNHGTRTMTGGGELTRACLAGSQVALALVLLVCAALLAKSFVRLTSTDTGFAADHVATLTIDLPESTYDAAPRILAFQDALLTRIAAAPGVAAVGLVNWLPLGGWFNDGDVVGDDHRKLPDDFSVDKPAVSADYFRAMGIRVTRGRAFTSADDAGSLRVAIVSASAARALWPDHDPIGRRLSLEDKPVERDWLTVVGVVDDVRQQQLAMPREAAVYQPYPQVDRPGWLRHVSFVARTAGDPGSLAPSLRAALRDVDPNLPADQVLTMTDVVKLTVAEPRFQAGLIAGFAGLALALALVGVYGVLAYAVTQRTREISIRLALGAHTSQVLTMILGRTAVLAGAGAAVGIVGAALAAIGLADLDLLFDVSPRDPAIFAGVACALVGAALLAGLIPAIRAGRVDPIVALRQE